MRISQENWMSQHFAARNPKKILAALAIAGLLFPPSPAILAGAQNAPASVAQVQQTTAALQAAPGLAPQGGNPQAQAAPPDSGEAPQILHLMVGRSLVV